MSFSFNLSERDLGACPEAVEDDSHDGYQNIVNEGTIDYLVKLKFLASDLTSDGHCTLDFGLWFISRCLGASRSPAVV